jgi:hypothetical protein
VLDSLQEGPNALNEMDLFFLKIALFSYQFYDYCDNHIIQVPVSNAERSEQDHWVPCSPADDDAEEIDLITLNPKLVDVPEICKVIDFTLPTIYM